MTPTHQPYRLFLLGVAVALVPIATLFPDPSSGATQFRICFFCGATGSANVIQNVMLFMPLGAALASFRLRTYEVALLGLVFSIGMEAAQLPIPGRSPSVADVVANATGSALGAFALRSAQTWLRPSSALSWMAAALAAFVLLATPYLLRPSLTRSVYWGHWTPNLGHLEWYRGQVVSARIDTFPLPSYALPHPAAVRDLILNGGEMRVNAVAGPPVSRLGSLFHISDARQRNIYMLGPDRDDLALRYRSHANALRFASPMLRVPGAFAGLKPGDSLFVSARLASDGFCLVLNQTQACPARFSTGTGWAFLYYPGFIRPPLTRWLDLAWMAGISLFVGFWSASRRALAIQAVLILAVTLLAGTLTGLVSAGLAEMLGVVVGIAAGAGLQVIVAGLTVANTGATSREREALPLR